MAKAILKSRTIFELGVTREREPRVGAMNGHAVIPRTQCDNELIEPMPVDPLSDAFRSVRMTGAAFFRVIADGTPIAEQLPSKAALSTMLGGAEHMITCYIVTEGSWFARPIGGGAVEVRAGQFVMFPKGDLHVISSEPGESVDQAATGEFHFTSAELQYAFAISGESLPKAEMVCGFLACDSLAFDLLIENLPPILVGDCSDGIGLPPVSEFIQLAMEESDRVRVGGQTILGRLAELMFIDVVRQHVNRLPSGSRTWLSGLRDESVGRAIALMHGDPRRAWSLSQLAREVGLSRSRFAERFTMFVGIPPMQYLAKWRMQTAAGLLCESVNIASIADEVGYSSEASFSRAFKKITGVPPSHWRRRDELMAA